MRSFQGAPNLTLSEVTLCFLDLVYLTIQVTRRAQCLKPIGYPSGEIASVQVRQKEQKATHDKKGKSM